MVGVWAKRRRPRPKPEEIGADQIVQYRKGGSAFHKKATVNGILSILRCMGEYLMRREVWMENPMRWMPRPKLDWQRQAPPRPSTAISHKWKGSKRPPTLTIARG